MFSIFLEKLRLQNYRNFSQLEIKSHNNKILIIGENGSGKTNILEAISLLFPGRGLRNTKLDEICRLGTANWSSTALLNSKIGFAEIYTSFEAGQSKRLITFNGAKIASSELSNLSSIVWLTPQMDGIFLEAPSIRLKFFDRIVYNFINNHAAIVNKYNYYLHERIKILQHEAADNNWLNIIEEKIADASMIIASNRISAINSLQPELAKLTHPFPQGELLISGSIEEKLLSKIEVPQIIEFVKAQLKLNRISDRSAKRTGFGIHKSDFVVINAAKNIRAKFCSTGEQKAMLISLVLAQVNSLTQETQTSPILLLDEIFAHLDNERKQYLINFFSVLNSQIWITSTDCKGIESLADKAQVISL